ncbi:MAG TPA: quinol:electron acceptor oxidoreductase subunit ActD [Bryobacteraceae bacterium]|nr:quinol:electron acceptor oxidoreductase subunit ActD [Bryobacteraceae bacterium]
MYLSGEFPDKEATARALLDLRAEGFESDALDVFSDKPLDLPPTVLNRPSHMSFIVVVSAITFGLLVIGFVYFTQYNYPLITGGMPLFSFWATGVIFYELTMFGAIVTTFFWFLIESGLLRRGRRAPTPKIESGAICVRVRCRSDQADSVGLNLKSAGAKNVRSVGDAA